MRIVGWGEGILFFVCGAVAYPALEVLWRGYSHYSMALAGGVCCLMLYLLHRLFFDWPLLLRAVGGAFVITLVEFIFGAVFNLLLGMAVWDYSDVRFNLLGQVCLRYFLLWCGLSAAFSFLVSPAADDPAASEKYSLRVGMSASSTRTRRESPMR